MRAWAAPHRPAPLILRLRKQAFRNEGRAKVQPISMPVSVFVLRVARYESLSECSDASSSVECMNPILGYRVLVGHIRHIANALDARDPV